MLLRPDLVHRDPAAEPARLALVQDARAGGAVLIIAILVDLGLWDLGHATHNWKPLAIGIPAGLAVVWLHRRDYL
jgi:hypothetical protein